MIVPERPRTFRRRAGPAALAGVIGVVHVAAALAGASGLATVPTADIVPRHGVTFQFQNGNTSLREDPKLWSRLLPVIQTQFGLAPSLEAGVDLVPVDSPGDYRPQCNVKWRPLEEDYDWPAIAGGITQIGSGQDAAGYLLVTRTLNYREIRNRIFRAHHRNIKLRGRRLHAGVFRQRGRSFPLLGAEFELSDHVVLVGDWIGGAGRTLDAGATFVFNESSSLGVFAVRGNDSGRVDGVLFSFTHTITW